MLATSGSNPDAISFFRITEITFYDSEYGGYICYKANSSGGNFDATVSLYIDNELIGTQTRSLGPNTEYKAIYNQVVAKTDNWAIKITSYSGTSCNAIWVKDSPPSVD